MAEDGTEKVHGTRNEYRQVKKDDYLLVDGLHEATCIRRSMGAGTGQGCGTG